LITPTVVVKVKLLEVVILLHLGVFQQKVRKLVQIKILINLLLELVTKGKKEGKYG
jgi:hypothetical protein